MRKKSDILETERGRRVGEMMMRYGKTTETHDKEERLIYKHQEYRKKRRTKRKRGRKGRKQRARKKSRRRKSERKGNVRVRGEEPDDTRGGREERN